MLDFLNCDLHKVPESNPLTANADTTLSSIFIMLHNSF